MSVYTGILKEIGPGTVGAKEVRRSFVDIGDRRLFNLGANHYLDDALTKAVAQGGQASLSVWWMPPLGRTVVAIRLPDGQRRSIKDERGVVFGYYVLMVMVGVVVGLFGGCFFGACLGNLGLFAALGVMFLYPIIGILSLSVAVRAV